MCCFYYSSNSSFSGPTQKNCHNGKMDFFMCRFRNMVPGSPFLWNDELSAAAISARGAPGGCLSIWGRLKFIAGLRSYYCPPTKRGPGGALSCVLGMWLVPDLYILTWTTRGATDTLHTKPIMYCICKLVLKWNDSKNCC